MENTLIEFNKNFAKFERNIILTVRKANEENEKKYFRHEGETFTLGRPAQKPMKATLLQIFRGKKRMISGPFFSYLTEIELLDGYSVYDTEYFNTIDEDEDILVLLLKENIT